MQTFTAPRPMVFNPRYHPARAKTLAALDFAAIDPPIVDIVRAMAQMPCCFPLQSCCGHFIHGPGQDPHSLDPLTAADKGPVRYRIAYIALCIANDGPGRGLYAALSRVPAIDPGTIQFGSADWFWRQQANSYVLQVEPLAYADQDEAILEPAEAMHVQRVRDAFFDALRRRVGTGRPPANIPDPARAKPHPGRKERTIVVRKNPMHPS